VGNAGVEIEGKMRKKQLGVVCIKVVVQGKGGDESNEGASVHDEKQRTEKGPWESPQEEVYFTQGRESVILGSKSLYCIYFGALWTRFSVITSLNRNLCR